jgi:uncharacterized membrane protein YkoI
MFPRPTLFAVLAGLALFAIGHTAARAETSRDAAEIAALRNATTSLGQAIATAEHAAGGKAIDASLDNDNGTMSYRIDILKNKSIETVRIDLGTGQVRKIAPADAEPGEGGEANDQENSD